PGATPETMDAEVRSKREGAAARVSGVKSIRSSSEENSRRIVVEFQPGVDLDDAASEMREAEAQVERELPDDIEQVGVVKADDDAEAVVSLAISSEAYSTEALTRRVDTDIAPEFLS